MLVFRKILLTYLIANETTSEIQRNGPYAFNPLSANNTKWSNTLKQFVGWYRRII